MDIFKTAQDLFSSKTPPKANFVLKHEEARLRCLNDFEHIIEKCTSDLELQESFIRRVMKGFLDPMVSHLTTNIISHEELVEITKNDHTLKTIVADLGEKVYQPG